MVVWASVCSFVSTLLRNFAAYAAMLAGYTLIIIAGTSIASPDQVFEIAVGRASGICIGIVCGTVVIALTDLGDSQPYGQNAWNCKPGAVVTASPGGIGGSATTRKTYTRLNLEAGF
jgi:hypothetical protein